MFDQPRRKLAQPRQAHVYDQRLVRLREFRPVEIDHIVTQVPGNEADRLCPVPVGQRYARIGRASEGGRDARNDLEIDAVPAQRLDLLAAAAEDEGVSALEAGDPQAALRIPQQAGVDVRLPGAGESAPLADVNTLRIAAAEIKHGRRDEIVVVDDVRTLQRAQRLQGEEVRVAGTRTHKRYEAFGRASRRETLKFRVRRRFVACGDERGDVTVQGVLPHTAAGVEVRHCLPYARTPAAEELSQSSGGSRQQGFDLFPDTPRERRRCTRRWRRQP